MPAHRTFATVFNGTVVSAGLVGTLAPLIGDHSGGGLDLSTPILEIGLGLVLVGALAELLTVEIRNDAELDAAAATSRSNRAPVAAPVLLDAGY